MHGFKAFNKQSKTNLSSRDLFLLTLILFLYIENNHDFKIV